MRKCHYFIGIWLINAFSVPVLADDVCSFYFIKGEYSEARRICEKSMYRDSDAMFHYGMASLLVFIGDENLTNIIGNGINRSLWHYRDTLKKYVNYLSYAANDGHADAQFYYGVLNYRLHGFTKELIFSSSKEEDIELEGWLEKSAEGGNLFGMYFLGMRGVKRGLRGNYIILNEHRYQYLVLAARQQFKPALEIINIIQNVDARDVENEMKINRYLDLGYKALVSINRNPDLAIEWFEKAVALGSNAALLHLGRIYKRDDPKTSKMYLSRAIERGLLEGYIVLGDMYACHGDKTKAIEQYRLALSLGYSFAKFSIDELEQYGVSEDYCLDVD